MSVTRTRYSEAFKRQVVAKMEGGEFGSLHAACQAYGIGGTSTVSRWLRQYGREDLLPKNVRVETLKERDKLKEARKRVRELEASLADMHMDVCLEKAFFRLLCEEHGKDPEVVKKNCALTQSSLLRKVRDR